MLSGLYSAASAMDAAEARHLAASRNLAHADHPGHHRRIIKQTTFEEKMRDEYGNIDDLSRTTGTSVSETDLHIDFSQGPLEQTQRPLDLAIQGDAFFTIEGPEGPLYTRNGRFHVNSEGTIVTTDGLAVRSQNGPMTLPTGSSPSDVYVDTIGRVMVRGEELGQLELMRFNNPQQLQEAGVSLFSDSGAAGAESADTQVVQGFFERSNVTPINELVSILVSSRQYESARRALTKLDDSVHDNIGLNR